MTVGTEYGTLYKKAYIAYGQGNLEEAAALVELMAREYPDDPNILLLQGHVSLNRQQYAAARQCYQSVLRLSKQQDLLEFARQGLEQLQGEMSAHGVPESDFSEAPATIQAEGELTEAESSQSVIEGNDWESTILKESDSSSPPAWEELAEATADAGAGAGFDFTDTNFPEDFTPLASSESNWNSEALEAPGGEESDDTGEDSFLDRLDLTDAELAEFSQLQLQEMSGELENLDHLSTVDFSQHLEQQILASPTAPESEARGKSQSDLAGSPFLPAKPTVEGKTGWLARIDNAPLRQKSWIVAAAAGLAPILAILAFSGVSWLLSPKQPDKKAIAREQPAQGASFSPLSQQGGWLLLLAGGASFGTALWLGQLAAGQTKRSLDNLQAQFAAIYQGNLNVRATVYSTDESGQLAANFNQFWQEIAAATGNAEHRASEVEEAKEELQRQVIRLLDDVEGAAKGDLTVEAKVTADILGAVADAFNLTIQNLREVLWQMKQAAKQVNQGATDSASFARKNSTESLRMAEELAVTLQSVQMMNESIQRVAESAREAETVARTSSLTALKGGEAVELTVAGVLQIRETVYDTTRKVKRLAEASQEISKIVAAISQISSRTNLLALNASLQAARAGEAGRGFAVVADEVRQLADRSAKSLKEIEQIVTQIQGETNSVMNAMEDGLQQVLDVSEKSEQAKSALEEIIEVSNHINQLVQSITADTIQQKENSQAVAQVMQSVETTAQETSQESQRVAGSLQKLVSISRDLLESVDKFRIEA
jgi:twitching motility protein PilJ